MAPLLPSQPLLAAVLAAAAAAHGGKPAASTYASSTPDQTRRSTAAAGAGGVGAGGSGTDADVTVASGDGLALTFGSGSPVVTAMSVGGSSVGPAEARFTGFRVSELQRSLGNRGKETVANGDFAKAGANASAALGWAPAGACGYTRVSDSPRTPGGAALLAMRAAASQPWCGATQTVTFDTTAPPPTSLVLSGWSRASQVSGEPGADYSVYCDLEYTDGTHLYTQTANFATGTHGWQQATTVISLLKPVRLASVYVLLRGNRTGKAWFADVSMAPLSPLVLTDGAATDVGNGAVAVRAAAGAPASLAVEATFKGQPDCIRVTGSVTRTDANASDRAVSLTLALPLNATAWHHPSDLDSDVVLGPWDAAVGPQYDNDAMPHPTDYYPFITLRSGDGGGDVVVSRGGGGGGTSSDGNDGGGASNSGSSGGGGRPSGGAPDGVGLALGVAVDGPVFVSRAQYVGLEGVLSVTADFALTRRAAHFPGVANFSFVLFRVGAPKWGFRAALARYYSLFPGFSNNVIREQGLWLVAQDNLSAIENYSDFGFRFEEGGGTPAECRQFNAAGVGVFPYIEPHLIHWALPQDTPVDYAHIVASVRACHDAGASCPQAAKARAVLTSGVVDAEGNLRWRPEDAEWNFGCVFWVDLDPDSRSDYLSHVASLIGTVEGAYASAKAGNYSIAGIYIDSVANAQELLNYRATTLNATRFPPVFDKNGTAAVLMLQNTQRFLDFLNEVELGPRGGVLMGNGPFYPQTQYRLAPTFAVTGGETFWFAPHQGRPFTPTPRELLALHRVLAYQKPYLPLQDSDFFRWTSAMSRQYFEVELTMGMWPGFFSGNAASFPYFRNRTWYNRDRPLFQTFVPALREMNAAGWQPVTSAAVATASPPAASRVWVERFGPAASGGACVYFTVRNEGRPDLARSLTLEVDGGAVGVQPGRHTVVDLTRGMSTVALADAAGTMAVVLDAATVGGVAVNQTVALKISLKADA